MEFVRTRQRNEALDLMCYNLGAFRSLNANMPVIQKRLEEVRKVDKPRIKSNRRNWATQS